MSPELETLDQLLGGDMSLATLRAVYPDHHRFARGVAGLLAAGDVKLLDADAEVPPWRWPAVLSGDLVGFRLALTQAGVDRVS